MTVSQSNAKHRVKFVYFDIGNVLLYFAHVPTVIAEKYNLDPQNVEDFFYEHIDWLCTDEMSIKEYSHKAAEHLSIDDPEFNWVEINNSALRPISESHELATEIAKVLPVGLLSDAWRGSPEVFFGQKLIPDLDYAAEVYSFEHGSVKPEDKLMAVAEEKAKVLPENILFIDDRASKLTGAKRRGWQTIQFDPDNPKKSVKIIRKHIKSHGVEI